MLELPDVRQAAAKLNGGTVVTTTTAAASLTNAVATLEGRALPRGLLAPPVSSPCIGGGALTLLGVFCHARGDGNRVERWPATTPSPGSLSFFFFIFFFVVVGQADRSAAKEVPTKNPYALTKACALSMWDTWIRVEGERLCVGGGAAARVG
ncbi:hypothetical protein BGW80DRAFT_1258562 [Lactifluus volemus]|nr:hypothetical protein BGW80DRAFT_1258562 [Lactifluus volemus]